MQHFARINHRPQNPVTLFLSNFFCQGSRLELLPLGSATSPFRLGIR